MVLLSLFWSFVKIGFTSFGGLSMIPLITSEMLSHGWMTAAEVTDIIAIAEMTPGPLGINCATFAGIHAAEKSKDVTVGELTLEHINRFDAERADAGIETNAVSPKLLPDYTRKKSEV